MFNLWVDDMTFTYYDIQNLWILLLNYKNSMVKRYFGTDWRF